MSDKVKKKIIICPDCLLTPKLSIIESLNDHTFSSECLLNHKHESKEIDYFLSEKASKKNFECPEHKPLHYCSFCKKCNKNICIDCYEYHENHTPDLIFFPNIKPKQKECE